jgi:hypothetical protein
MRIILYAFAACVIVYALQLAIAALMIVVIVAVLIGIIFRPGEMLQCIAMAAFWSLLERYPLPTLLIGAGLVCLSWLEVAIRRSLASAKSTRTGACERVPTFDLPRLPPP